MSAGARMLSNLSKISLLVLPLFLTMSCGQVKKESLLYGHYIAEYKYATEKVQLKKDGTFVQEISLKSRLSPVKAEGKWRFFSKTGYIEFDNNFMLVVGMFMKFNPDFTKKRKEGLVSQPVFKRFGKIYFGSDEGVLYKKIV